MLRSTAIALTSLLLSPTLSFAQETGGEASVGASGSAELGLAGGSASGSAELGLAGGSASGSAELDGGGGAGRSGGAGLRTPSFETGLRVGIGLPSGKAGQNVLGQERDLADLTPWRAPVWLDVGYRLSEAMTLGAYVQVGLGASGDECVGRCDWSDIRAGAQLQWHPSPGALLDPWLGVGVGYEWLELKSLISVDVMDPDSGAIDTLGVRVSEDLSGPELLLQGGLDFRVEEFFEAGPFVAASFGQYVSDGYGCEPNVGGACPTVGSVEGSAFHTWIGAGIRGRYMP